MESFGVLLDTVVTTMWIGDFRVARALGKWKVSYSQGAPPRLLHTLISQHRPKGHTNHQTLHLAVSPDSFPRQQMPPHASVY
jgi:hypothetical protein